MGKVALILFSTILFVGSCKERQPNVKVGKNGKDVLVFSPQDATMNDAMVHGNKTIDTFLNEFNNRKEGQDRFSVKVKLGNRTHTEYLWLDELNFETEKMVTGRLLNTPYKIENLNAGDSVSAHIDKIVDWSYVDNGYLIGGFTLRVMFEEYSEEQKAAIMQQMGYQIDPEIGI